jgi:hypothetical protein
MFPNRLLYSEVKLRQYRSAQVKYNPVHSFRRVSGNEQGFRLPLTPPGSRMVERHEVPKTVVVIPR